MPQKTVYRAYLLTVLPLLLAFNSVDRLALGLVLQNIKTDLSLSDTQLGLLTGIAFALFYALMGIPIARWADRGNRVTLMALATALASGAVALCGLAQSFLQLLLIRIAVGVGEAGCMPPAHSLIADNFSREERPRAVARFMLGAPLSMVIGYFVAGWLNELYGWRATFIWLGLPGLLLACLTWLTLHEPRMLGTAVVVRTSAATEEPALREVCATLWSNRAFRHLLLCYSVMSFFGYGIGQWKATFFLRSYTLQTGELGTWFALIYGVAGALGMYLGGELAARRAAGNEPLQLRAIAVVNCCSAAVFVAIFVCRNLYLALGFIAVSAILAASTSAPLFATIQTLVPERMRAMSIALMFLFANLIGLGLGPLAAGMLSDLLRPLFGEDSLRYALLALCPGYLWGAWHVWRASRTVRADLDYTASLQTRGRMYSVPGDSSAAATGSDRSLFHPSSMSK